MLKNLIGLRFGRLTVVAQEPSKLVGKSKNRVWRCLCECGNYTSVITTKLLSGNTKSCGCLGKQRRAEACFKHGLINNRIYHIWKGMKRRTVYNSKVKFDRYKGRGICMCEEWLNDFKKFYLWSISNGYEEGLTIDRINNDGDYSPTNCRWASQKTQARNKSTNVWFLLNGNKICLKDLLKAIDFPQTNYYRHIREGKDKVKDIFKGVDFNKYNIEILRS